MAKRGIFVVTAAFSFFLLGSCTRLFNECSNPRTAVVGQGYFESLCPSSSFHQYDIVSGRLPAHIRFDSYTGSLSGTPTDGGIYRFKATVDNTLFNSKQDFTLYVRNIGLTPLFMPEQRFAGRAGAQFMATLTPTGGTAPYHFGVITALLPAGLILDANTGVISGIPATGGNYGGIFEVSDSSNPAQRFSANINLAIN